MKATDPPKLIALTGPTAGHVVELQADAMSAGREPENDIVLETQYVSRQHCRFEKTDDCFRVVDLDSHNGTSVNGIPVKERLLAPGDRISLGGASFLFVDPSAPPAATELELEDAPLPSGATVQLRAEDAVYLKPERLGDARLKDAETRNALGATLELISLLGSTTDDALPDKILNQFVKLIPAERSAVLMGSDPENLDVLTMRPTPFAVSRTVIGKALGERTAILSNEVANDGDAGKSLIASKVRSLAAFPLAIEDRVIGAIYLDSGEPDASFPEDAMELLMGLASVAAVALEKARQLGRLRAENRQLQQEFDLIHEMVGESPKLKAAQTVIARAAPTETTVLITGESGTGKELAARAIHFNSNRRDRLLVKIDCTGLTENLLASELFGHEKGAFTGAVQQKKGKLEIADGGTAFFDEIGELPLALQSQLLRVLQDREFERVGGTRPLSVGHSSRGRDESRLRGRSQERQLSRGPLLPPQRCRAYAPSIERAPERHRASGSIFRLRVQQESEAARRRDLRNPRSAS